MPFLLAAFLFLFVHFPIQYSSHPIKKNVSAETKWEGSWSIKDSKNNYFTLTINTKSGATYPCILEVEGKGYFYKLHCTGVENAGALEIHYSSLATGKTTESFQSNQLLFSLKQKGMQTVTHWKKWQHSGEAETFKKL